MSVILNPLRRLFSSVQPLEPGIYHYQAPPDDPRNYRMHLRLEQDGSGVLILNAATILHLNHTAAEYVYHLIQNSPTDEVARCISQRYRVSRSQAAQDYQEFSERIRSLIDIPDLDPVTFLGFERQMPYTGQISAPYRLDIALTYRLPQGESPDSAPVDRVDRELTTPEWRNALSKAWEAGIPHIVFTGGEPTLREDLADLIAHAEMLGQVTGLISDGFRLADPVYLDSLLQTGLDHLMFILRPDNPGCWQALSNALSADLFVAVHLTIEDENPTSAIETLERLQKQGVRALSLSTSKPELASALESVRDRAAFLGLELVWNLPVPYSSLHPVAMELSGGFTVEGAGRAWLYVEPDGDVRPAPGSPEVLGNLFNDPWVKIWKK